MQSGTIVKRGRYWYLRYYRPVLVGGKTVNRQTASKLVKVSPEFPNAEAVRAAGKTGAILGPLNAGAATAESTISVRDFLEHRYLPHVRESRKPSTHDGYSYRFDLLKPHLNGLELGAVRTVHVQRLLESVAASKPRANTTLKHVKAFLSGAFGYAVRNGLVERNYVRDTRSPRGLHAKDTYAYSLEEIKSILAVVEEPARTIVLTAALSGLRVGEIAGLKWEDIRDGVIHVERGIWKGEVVETKTEGSRAPVPLLPVLEKALALHRTRSVGEFVFTCPRGDRPIIADNVHRRMILPALEKAGLADVWHGWHAFRRGLATNLKALGIDDLTISRIMRHDGVAVTQASYIKSVAKGSAAAMSKLEKAFKSAK